MSQTTPPPAAVRRVPIGETIMEAYGIVLSQLGLVVRAAALPFLISIALALLSLLAAEQPLLALILLVVGFVPYTLFGVSWHRLTLLGPRHGAPPLLPKWRSRHWRFLGYAIAVMMILWLTSIPLVVLAALIAGPEGQAGADPARTLAVMAVAAVMIVAVPYVMMRLSFVFPAAAVDENYGLAHSWTHTRGQGFRLLGVVLLTSLPMLVLLWAIGAMFGVYVLPDLAVVEGQEGGASAVPQEEAAPHVIISQLVLGAINYVLMALVVSAISAAFRTCTGWVPAHGKSPVPRGGPGDADFGDR